MKLTEDEENEACLNARWVEEREELDVGELESQHGSNERVTKPTLARPLQMAWRRYHPASSPEVHDAFGTLTATYSRSYGHWSAISPQCCKMTPIRTQAPSRMVMMDANWRQ